MVMPIIPIAFWQDRHFGGSAAAPHALYLQWILTGEAGSGEGKADGEDAS
jgi:hypothetical protein